jgi:hypothetical protein
MGDLLVNPEIGYAIWALTGKAPVALDAPTGDAWRDRVISYFLEVSLGSEVGSSENRIRKWSGEVKVEVLGNATEGDRKTLNDVMFELNQLTGGQIKLTRVDSGGDIKIYFAPAADFAQYLEQYESESLGYFWMQWGEDYRIQSATILVDSTNEVSQQERSHLIREELTQSLGLANDSWKYQESVFYQGWTDTTQYGWIDRAMIMALYNPAVKPGMTSADVVKVMTGEPQ